MADIEAQRLDNLRNKERILAELNLQSHKYATEGPSVKREHEGPSIKRRKVTVSQTPTRASARIQRGGARPSYKEEPDSVRGLLTTTTKQKASRNKAVPFSKREDEEVSRILAVDLDTLRQNWSKWEVQGSPPTRDEDGTFHFEDFSQFLPNKSPEEMIREGCFGGSYWRPLKSKRLGIVIEGDWKELPSEWITGLDVKRYLTSPAYDADVNKYKVACGQSIEEWEASGWIMHEYDVRGWFQWYCRFFQGRRCPDDDRQVSRWRKCVGATGRWKRMLLKAYLRQGVREVFDDGEDEETKEVSPVKIGRAHV